MTPYESNTVLNRQSSSVHLLASFTIHRHKTIANRPCASMTICTILHTLLLIQQIISFVFKFIHGHTFKFHWDLFLIQLYIYTRITRCQQCWRIKYFYIKKKLIVLSLLSNLHFFLYTVFATMTE